MRRIILCPAQKSNISCKIQKNFKKSKQYQSYLSSSYWYWDKEFLKEEFKD